MVKYPKSRIFDICKITDHLVRFTWPPRPNLTFNLDQFHFGTVQFWSAISTRVELGCCLVTSPKFTNNIQKWNWIHKDCIDTFNFTNFGPWWPESSLENQWQWVDIDESVASGRGLMLHPRWLSALSKCDGTGRVTPQAADYLDGEWEVVAKKGFIGSVNGGDGKGGTLG